ncbi:uncharacterized protein LOC132718692 [Ruditapes philippinarum]|uniref:uncharacterized protein LOC132718692 n=1 Tax=Ruditapes philippinarum TaxID=129788 RepID=UPI00295BBA02|nr:uncharacterized protein LOC132718692 [Ruditapes philippinarum]
MHIILFACYLIVFRVYCLPTGDGNQGIDVINMDTDGEKEIEKDCTDIWCESYSLSEVHQMYKGLFMTEYELFLQQFMFDIDRDYILYKEGIKNLGQIDGSQGDGDSCCVTKQSTHIQYTMQNIFGQTRHIVHLTSAPQPKYQYITQAKCIGKRKCDGLCVLEDTVRTVLVYDTIRRQLTFDQLLVPTYCSCKRVSG